MSQCTGITKRGFRCKIKTRLGVYCRFHINNEWLMEETRVQRAIHLLIKWNALTINERTKNICISRTFNIDQFMDKESLSSSWKKRDLLKVLREECIRKTIKLKELRKHQITEDRYTKKWIGTSISKE